MLEMIHLISQIAVQVLFIILMVCLVLAIKEWDRHNNRKLKIELERLMAELENRGTPRVNVDQIRRRLDGGSEAETRRG